MPVLLPAIPSSLLPLAVALEERCSDTRWHCDRVGRLAWATGVACGLADAELQHLLAAARFHDIGKVGIPDAILFKPGRLEPDEFDIMKTHAERGERIFAAAGQHDTRIVAAAIRHHHERHDGSGYPDGLHGEQIPLLSRIVGFADSYDAMASARPYHRPRSHRDIMDVLRQERGRKSDPRLFDVFAQVAERHHAARQGAG